MPVRDGVKRPNTLVFNVPEELRDGSQDEFVQKIVAALPRHQISAVQFVPGYYVRVTFRSEQSRHEVFNAGFSIDGAAIRLVEADSTVRLVYVHHCPVEVPDSAIRDVLSEYGNVMSIQPGFHKGTTILNGSLVVKMSVTDEIPSKLYILRYPCRVWYRDQTQVCHICDKPGHIASKCPLRDVCRKCRQPGHFARNCRADRPSPAAPTDPPSAASSHPTSPTDASPAASTSPACDPVDADPPVSDDHPCDDSASDSSSECMETEELASGDEEILANAPSQIGSTRRTRSATARARAKTPSDSVPVSQPSFPPSGVSAAVSDASDVPSPPVDLPSSPDVSPVPMYCVNPGFLPPVFSTLAPVRSAPTDLRDAILAFHSAKSMFYTEKHVPVDGSSPVLSHVVIDHDFMTCAILEDNVTFESAREEYYAGCRSSSSASRPSPPACSAMPGVSPCVDLPPLLPCVAPDVFSFTPVDFDATSCDAIYEAFFSPSPTLDPMTFTSDEVLKLFPPEFFALSGSDQESFLRAFCGASYRDRLAIAIAESREADEEADGNCEDLALASRLVCRFFQKHH